MKPETVKQASIFLIIPAICLLFLTASPAAAELIAESAEIPYQVNHSDRIAIGTVGKITPYYDHTIFLITVEEWLYNPLPVETIKVRTEMGTRVWTEDQPEFEENEEVLVMLKDLDLEHRIFKVSVEEPGKHPVSDRDAVIEELKVQGKWQGGDETDDEATASEPEEGEENAGSGAEPENIPFIGQEGNETDEDGGTAGEPVEEEEEAEPSPEPESTPFIGLMWLIAAMAGAVFVLGRRE